MNETELMSNGTTQLVFSLAIVVITTLGSVVLWYLKKVLSTNKYAIEYNLNNERTERILENAIAYAVSKGSDMVKDKLATTELANKYIDKIAPDIIAKEGDKLELMIQRKIQQKTNQ